MADRFTRAFGSFLRRIVDMGDGTFSEQVVSKPPPNMVTGDRLKVELDEPIDVNFPPKLITSGGIGGTNPRLRVDIGETGFFAGREARTFKEFSIAAGQTLVLKFVVPINVILLQQGIELDDGSIRITNSIGGTPGGTFSETLPVIVKNNMGERPLPFYAPQVVVTAGGTITGATALDIHRVVAATATSQRSTVGNLVGDERGIAANTYHVSYQNFGSGVATGTLWFLWEERP